MDMHVTICNIQGDSQPSFYCFAEYTGIVNSANWARILHYSKEISLPLEISVNIALVK